MVKCVGWAEDHDLGQFFGPSHDGTRRAIVDLECHLETVPGRYTWKLKVMDVGINNPYKDTFQARFDDWDALQVPLAVGRLTLPLQGNSRNGSVTHSTISRTSQKPTVGNKLGCQCRWFEDDLDDDVDHVNNDEGFLDIEDYGIDDDNDDSDEDDNEDRYDEKNGNV
jgi:hypothetical protein